MEVWAPVKKDTYKIYAVSSMGRIWSANIGIMKIPTGKNGYPHLSLPITGKQQRHCVHRLVGLAFIPNPENKPHINHKNGIKTDNRVENLEWCTQSENIQHSFKFLGQKGSKNLHRRKTILASNENSNEKHTIVGLRETARFLNIDYRNIQQAIKKNCLSFGWKFKVINDPKWVPKQK